MALFSLCCRKKKHKKKKIEKMKFNNIESQNQLQPPLQQTKGATFIRTCFNGMNALTGSFIYFNFTIYVFIISN